MGGVGPEILYSTMDVWPLIMVQAALFSTARNWSSHLRNSSCYACLPKMRAKCWPTPIWPIKSGAAPGKAIWHLCGYIWQRSERKSRRILTPSTSRPISASVTACWRLNDDPSNVFYFTGNEEFPFPRILPSRELSVIGRWGEQKSKWMTIRLLLTA